MKTSDGNLENNMKKGDFVIANSAREELNFGYCSQHRVKNSQCELFFENTQENRIKDPVQDFGDMRLLKIREVATILGCSVKEAYTLSYECGLPTRKLKGRVRVLGSDLKKWLEGLPTKRRSAA